MALDFKLPELGENVTSGRLAKLLVAPGDLIEKDQAVIELETDKAVVEVPSDKSGVIKEILVAEGNEVKVGDLILVFEEGGSSASKEKPERKKKEDTAGSTQTKEKVSETVSSGGEEITRQLVQKKSSVASEDKVVIVRLPELGENVQKGTVTKILVSAGDTVEANQNILELETEKAVIEIPLEMKGVVQDILVKEGEEIKIGQEIIRVKTSGARPEKEKEKPVRPEAGLEEPPPRKDVSLPPESEKEREAGEEEPSASSTLLPHEKKETVPAAPSVRRFAREIGIPIAEVPGTGPSGRISFEDIKNYAKTLNRQRTADSAVLKGIVSENLPDFSKWGKIDRQPMSKIRQTTARHLGYAWATIPHVTQFDKADITELEKLRKQYAPPVEAAGGKLTMTAILLKICAAALKKFPQFNASVDMDRFEIIYKKYINIGIAVDTDRGLLVPVVREVDGKNITQLSVELSDLAGKARQRKLSLEDMQGGNFSISNLGGIGGTGFSPVVNAPEVAILGVSRGEIQPVFMEGEFQPRLMLPLSLSYDHRLIDGADAARFLRWVAEALQQPFRILLEG